MVECVFPSPKCTAQTVEYTNEIVRFTRSVPPAHFVFKVESFTSLRESLAQYGHDSFNLTEFAAGGYTWSVTIYPDGNVEENGDNHISLYLELIDKLEKGVTVTALFKFFIYDQLRDNYLIVQDLREKRFHTMKNKWGISNVISLELFNDDANGFLVNDCCVFGAEVFVIANESKAGMISNVLKDQCNFTWNVHKFSKLKEETYSPIFTCGSNCSWKVSLWRNGNGDAMGKYLSIFLKLVNGQLMEGKKMFVQFSLCLKCPYEGVEAEDESNCLAEWFSASDAEFGCPKFVPLSRLQHFIMDDTMIIDVSIEGIFMMADIH